MLLDKIKKILHEYSEKMTIYFTRKIKNSSGDAILIYLGGIFFIRHHYAINVQCTTLDVQVR